MKRDGDTWEAAPCFYETVWACFTAQRSLHFPSLEWGLFLSHQHFTPLPPPHPLIRRSGCLTTAAAVQECLPYNVTHISKCESALLLLCVGPLSPRRSLSRLGSFLRNLVRSLMSQCPFTFPAAVNTNAHRRNTVYHQGFYNGSFTGHYVSPVITKPLQWVKVWFM